MNKKQLPVVVLALLLIAVVSVVLRYTATAQTPAPPTALYSVTTIPTGVLLLSKASGELTFCTAGATAGYSSNNTPTVTPDGHCAPWGKLALPTANWTA